MNFRKTPLRWQHAVFIFPFPERLVKVSRTTRWVRRYGMARVVCDVEWMEAVDHFGTLPSDLIRGSEAKRGIGDLLPIPGE